MIVGLERPSAGSIRFGGAELAGLSARAWFPHRRRMQMIFQDPYASLDPRQKVGAIVAEPLAIHGQGDARERRRRADELLESVGLPASCAGRYPHEFSGGQRQRIGIARALALGPELLVCDEPTSALDVSIQAQIVNLLRELRERHRLALLLIAHDLAVVRHLCDEVAVMYLGRIVEHAPRERLFTDPVHPYTRALLSAVPRPDPVLERARERIVLAGDPPSPIDPPPGCAFHPRCAEKTRVEGGRCEREVPALARVSGTSGGSAACHLVGPVART
jgi:oligopeptide/dipeptide ABC transporter ATP-binding protein